MGILGAVGELATLASGRGRAKGRVLCRRLPVFGRRAYLLWIDLGLCGLADCTVTDAAGRWVVDRLIEGRCVERVLSRPSGMLGVDTGSIREETGGRAASFGNTSLQTCGPTAVMSHTWAT